MGPLHGGAIVVTLKAKSAAHLSYFSHYHAPGDTLLGGTLDQARGINLESSRKVFTNGWPTEEQGLVLAGGEINLLRRDKILDFR